MVAPEQAGDLETIVISRPRQDVSLHPCVPGSWGRKEVVLEPKNAQVV
jgi:hypothetical protein